jgi:hypothetical protein
LAAVHAWKVLNSGATGYAGLRLDEALRPGNIDVDPVGNTIRVNGRSKTEAGHGGRSR